MPSLLPTASLLHQSNILALVTAPPTKISEVPRITQSEIIEFLSYLVEGFFDDQPFLLTDRTWEAEIQHAANKARAELDSYLLAESQESGPYLSASTILSKLRPLSQLFNRYALFGLAVGSFANTDHLHRRLRKTVLASQGNLLLLDSLSADNSPCFGVLDPLLPTALLAERPEYWPGIVFWNHTGASAFMPESDLATSTNHILDELLSCVRDSDVLDEFLRNYTTNWSRSKSLLHISDLHFGRDEIAPNVPLLINHLTTKLKLVNRVVVTGDLLQSPDDTFALNYQVFHAAIRGIGVNDPIVIPGNHDQNWKGIAFKSRELLLELIERTPRVIIDDDIGVTFFCLDSSRDAKGSNGIITHKQMREIESDYSVKASRHTDLSRHLRLAIIHHHPFTFTEEGGTRIDRTYRYIEEKKLLLENAEEFHIWCANRGIPLILHGHKHVPRHSKTEVTYGEILLGNVENFWLESIGCGTSLGAEGYKMSYNVLIWDSTSGRWCVTFWQDTGLGVFKRQFLKTEILS